MPRECFTTSLIFWPLAWLSDGVISVRATKHSSILASCLLLLSAIGLTERADAAVYNLHLVTDNVPDYTNLESFVESIAGHLDTPQEKCIAVWRWGRSSPRHTGCSGADGRLI